MTVLSSATTAAVASTAGDTSSLPPAARPSGSCQRRPRPRQAAAAGDARDPERTEELDRHGHPRRQPVDRGIDRQVHPRQRDAEAPPQPELLAAATAKLRPPDDEQDRDRQQVPE